MVLRFDSGDSKKKGQQEVFFIEATANLGVKIKKWSNLRLSLGQFYERIVLRHLEFHRDETSFLQLDKFLEEVNGHSFSFKASMLVKRDTVKMDTTK